jgi:cyclic lactone autoinducer peptide
MKKQILFLRYIGTAFAFVALVVAQVASTRFSLIYYQDVVPEKVKELRS